MQGSLSNAYGGPFAVLNGAIAQDVLCIATQKGVNVTTPIYVLYISTGSSATTSTSSSDGAAAERGCSAPRLLVDVAADSTVEVIEVRMAGA